MSPTAEQQRAIDSEADQILCVAGPGSGKTLTLVERILRLIRSGVDPSDICAIVFTNDAARVIHERLHPEGGEFAVNLGFLGTLHSFCLRHLQECAGMTNVTVLDEDEADEELIRCAKDAGVKASPKELMVRREHWNVRQFDERRDAIHIAVASYYRKMEANRALDFNSILTQAFRDLKAAPQRQRAWRHLLVDEFQDASRLDFEIYMAVAAANRFFVGDPDQAVFGWRGGDIHGILSCAKDGGWEKIFLEGNFRSGSAICEVAQRLVENDRERVQKVTRSLTDKAGSVGSACFESDVEEAVKIAAAVAGQLDGGRPESEIAVLARTNSIVDAIASTLGAHGTRVKRRTPPQLPSDWRTARAALRMLQARNDDSIVRYLRCVDPEVAAESGKLAALGKLKLRDTYMAGLECHVAAVGRDLTRLRISRGSIERIEKMVEALPEPTMADLLLMCVQNREHEEEGEGVTCTTVHGAKGREWDTVIIAGCEEETTPGTRCTNVEEERRIMYVAMTRARETLIVTWAEARRQNWGRRDYRGMTRSRFLAEAGI